MLCFLHTHTHTHTLHWQADGWHSRAAACMCVHARARACASACVYGTAVQWSSSSIRQAIVHSSIAPCFEPCLVAGSTRQTMVCQACWGSARSLGYALQLDLPAYRLTPTFAHPPDNKPASACPLHAALPLHAAWFAASWFPHGLIYLSLCKPPDPPLCMCSGDCGASVAGAPSDVPVMVKGQQAIDATRAIFRCAHARLYLWACACVYMRVCECMHVGGWVAGYLCVRLCGCVDVCMQVRACGCACASACMRGGLGGWVSNTMYCNIQVCSAAHVSLCMCFCVQQRVSRCIPASVHECARM